MGYQNWSDNIICAELAEDPVFSEDIENIRREIQDSTKNVVLNFSAVDFLNSSNISALLRLRQQVLDNKCRLVLCGLNSQVWGVFLVTGLDKVFEYTDDMASALATVQM